MVLPIIFQNNNDKHVEANIPKVQDHNVKTNNILKESHNANKETVQFCFQDLFDSEFKLSAMSNMYETNLLHMVLLCFLLLPFDYFY